VKIKPLAFVSNRTALGASGISLVVAQLESIAQSTTPTTKIFFIVPPSNRRSHSICFAGKRN
jgi:hypothetical protein